MVLYIEETHVGTLFLILILGTYLFLVIYSAAIESSFNYTPPAKEKFRIGSKNKELEEFRELYEIYSYYCDLKEFYENYLKYLSKQRFLFALYFRYGKIREYKKRSVEIGDELNVILNKIKIINLKDALTSIYNSKSRFIDLTFFKSLFNIKEKFYGFISYCDEKGRLIFLHDHFISIQFKSKTISLNCIKLDYTYDQSYVVTYDQSKYDDIKVEWRYQRRDGGPDLRYNNNYKTIYGLEHNFKVTFNFGSIKTTYTKRDAADKFKNNLDLLKKNLVLASECSDSNYENFTSEDYSVLAVSIRELKIHEGWVLGLNNPWSFYETKIIIPACIKNIDLQSVNCDIESVKTIKLPSEIEMTTNCFCKFPNLMDVGYGPNLFVYTLKSKCFQSSFNNTKINTIYLNINSYQYNDIDTALGFKNIIINDSIDKERLIQIFEGNNLIETFKVRNKKEEKRFDVFSIKVPSQVTHIEFPNIVTCISKNTFSSNNKIKEIYIPSSISYIEDGALDNIKRAKIILPNYFKDSIKVDSSNYLEFYETSIKYNEEVIIDESNYNDVKELFSAGTKKVILKTDKFNFSLRDFKEVVFDYDLPVVKEFLFFKGKIERAEFRDSTVIIGPDAFSYCKELKEVVARGVKNIGKNAFAHSPNFKNLITDNYLIVGEAAFSFSGIEEILVENISKNSFHKCVNLEKVVLDKSITKIPSNAFSGCQNLKVINTDNVKTLGTEAFADCISLKNVNFKSLKKIENGSFKNCESLIDFSFITELVSIGEESFSGAKQLKEIKLNKITTIPQKAFINCTMLKSVNIPNVVSIGPYAFENTAIEDLDFLGENVSLDVGAFKNCLELISTDSAAFKDKIPDETFSGCLGINNLFINNKIKIIGKSAFEGCSNLETVSGMLNIETIQQDAFKGCNIKELILPQSLTIFDNPICNCNKLNTLVFLGTLDTLNLTFEGLDKLKTLYLPLDVTNHSLRDPYLWYSNRDFYFLRGTTWIKNYNTNNIYPKREEYYEMINRFANQAGYLKTGFEEITINDDFKVPSSRAGFSITELAGTKEDVIIEEKPRINYKTEIKELGIAGLKIDFSIKEEIIAFSGLIASALFEYQFNPKSYSIVYSLLVNDVFNVISNQIKVFDIDDQVVKVTHELNNDVKDGIGYIVLLDSQFKQIDYKKVKIERTYNIDDLFDL